MSDIDTLPPSITELFSTEQTWQSWLDVEAALALTQAELNMIPAAYGAQIAQRAHLEKLDIPALRSDIQATMAPVFSVVNALAKACDQEVGGYVHWGATTQNIILTGRLLQMHQAHALLLRRLGRSLEALAKLAKQEANTVMVGRTNHKHALPITLGFKLSAWIEELTRCVARLEQLEPRTFTLIFGGAIGAMHTFGAKGTELTQALARRLKLTHPLVHSRAMLDPFCEYLLTLALFGMTCSRIGNELYRLMSEEIDEVAEILPGSVVGSSTMPHKNNPKLVVILIARAAKLRSIAAPALEAGQPSHEGDAACNQQMYALIDEACPLAYELATRLEQLLHQVQFKPEQMHRNLSLSAHVIASEHLMMLLANKLGRQEAHHKVHSAIRTCAQQNSSLPDLLYQDPSIQANYSKQELKEALDPTRYTGNSSITALAAAELAQAVALRLDRP